MVKNTAVLDPPDANHTYSAKVGLSDIQYIELVSTCVDSLFKSN